MNKIKLTQEQFDQGFEIVGSDICVATKDENGSDIVNSCKTIEVEGQEIRVVNGLWLPIMFDTYYIIKTDGDVRVCAWTDDLSHEYRRKTGNIFLTDSHAQLVIDYKLFLFDNMVRERVEKWYEINITNGEIEEINGRYAGSDRISIYSTEEVKDQFIKWQAKLAPIRLYNPFV